MDHKKHFKDIIIFWLIVIPLLYIIPNDIFLGLSEEIFGALFMIIGALYTNLAWDNYDIDKMFKKRSFEDGLWYLFASFLIFMCYSSAIAAVISILIVLFNLDLRSFN